MKKHTIVVAEDAEVNLMLLIDILSSKYKVKIAKNGVQALDVVSASPPDLILLDIMMPEMDGYMVCKHLKETPELADIPVIFITSMSDHQSIVEGFKVGAVDFVQKPFNSSELLARVETHLELSTTRKQLQNINAELEYLSLHDDLTGLYNTRHLYSVLEQYFSSELSGCDYISLVFMDIDNFKNVVDTYGHLNGSQAIKEVAQTISVSINEPSFGVAYGGDEYVVVLPGHDKKQAFQQAEAIRALIGQTTYLSEAGHDINLSCSFGIATSPTDAKDFKTLLAKADSQLFRIKETGKGQIGSC